MAVRRKGHSTMHEVIFAVVVTATLYVMVDLEFPRYGLIRNDDADQALHNTRAGMNGPGPRGADSPAKSLP